jgi:hypothetical protein
MFEGPVHPLGHQTRKRQQSFVTPAGSPTLAAQLLHLILQPISIDIASDAAAVTSC